MTEIENLNELNIFSERLANKIYKAAESSVSKAKKKKKLVNYPPESASILKIIP